MNEINLWLRSQRIGDGKTQMEIAESLKLTSPQVVSNYERGTHLSPRFVYNLCKKNKWSWHDAKQCLLNDYLKKLSAITKQK